MSVELVNHLNRLEQKMDANLHSLTQSIHELAQAIAKKEVSDQHLKEQMNEIKARQKELEKDIDDLQAIATGDKAIRQLITWVVGPALGAAGVALAQWLMK